MGSIRQERIGQTLQKEIGAILQRDASSKYVRHFITVTSVRISPDLGLARVNLSFMALNNAGTPEEGLALVMAEGHLIRKELAAKVANHLRRVPELRFHIDDTLDRYEEINDLLKDL
jgi:ribosome-binding factor A